MNDWKAEVLSDLRELYVLHGMDQCQSETKCCNGVPFDTEFWLSLLPRLGELMGLDQGRPYDKGAKDGLTLAFARICEMLDYKPRG